MRTRATRTAVALRTGLGFAAVFGAGAGISLTAQAVPAGATNSHPKTITISTANVSHVGTVLTTSSGRTLYRFTEDPAKKSTCVGACAKIWPPLRVTKGTHIEGPKGVKGLSLINVGDGHWQVAFHNVALYRFEGDTKKGQAKGQAVGGLWYAVLKSGIPVGAAPAAPAASTSTTTPPPTNTSQQPPMSTSQPPATQPTSPARTSPPATSPPPTSPPTTSPPPTTTPTTTAGNGGVGF